MNEHSAKIPQNIKDQINADITKVNEAVTSEDADQIREAVERLKNSSMEIGKAMFSQNQEGAAEGEQSQNAENEQQQEGEKTEEKKDEEKK